MLLGYNTNGFLCHDIYDAINLLADLGYESIAITIDHHVLSPNSSNWSWQLRRLKRLLQRRRLKSVIETGARFLLDPVRKHEPTLLSSDPIGRRKRVDFYTHALRCAAELESACVSIWSGSLQENTSEQSAWDWLCSGLESTLKRAEQLGVPVGFEPEPGMFVDTLAKFRQLYERIDHPLLKLTLDVGHLYCQGELPVDNHIRSWQHAIVNIHLEDMRRGEHEHLMFGEGEVDFHTVLTALTQIGYEGGVHVELSRHSHVAPVVAKDSISFLSRLLEEVKPRNGT